MISHIKAKAANTKMKHFYQTKNPKNQFEKIKIIMIIELDFCHLERITITPNQTATKSRKEEQNNKNYNFSTTNKHFFSSFSPSNHCKLALAITISDIVMESTFNINIRDEYIISAKHF